MTIINKIINILIDLEDKGFYGSVTIKFENGRIVIMRKEETIKFDEE